MRVSLLPLATLGGASLAFAQPAAPPPPAAPTAPPPAAAAASAQSASPTAAPASAPAAERPPIFAPRPLTKQTVPKPGAPRAARAISPEMAAKLSAVANRAVPPPKAWSAAESAATSTGEGADGDTVQLDPFFVQEEKFPVFKEREMLTAKGKLELARTLYPGLRISPLNGVAAGEMMEDELQRIRNQEMKDLYEIQALGKNVPKDLKGKVDASQAKRKEWIDERGTPYRERK